MQERAMGWLEGSRGVKQLTPLLLQVVYGSENRIYNAIMECKWVFCRKTALFHLVRFQGRKLNTIYHLCDSLSLSSSLSSIYDP